MHQLSIRTSQVLIDNVVHRMRVCRLGTHAPNDVTGLVQEYHTRRRAHRHTQGHRKKQHTHILATNQSALTSLAANNQQFGEDI